MSEKYSKGHILLIFYLIGGNKENNNDNKNDDKKNDDANDDKNDEKPSSVQSLFDKMTTGDNKDDGIDYKEIAKDVFESEVTQDVIKTGISLLPGGPGILAAYNAAMKMSEVAGIKDKVPGLNKLKV